MRYVLISIFGFLCQNVANKEFGARYSMNFLALIAFQLLAHIAMAVSLLLLGARFDLSGDAVWLCALEAVLFLCTILLLTKTLSLGPIGKTTVIVNLSMLIPIALGALIWGEKFTVYRVLGIPCVLAALAFSVPARKGGERGSGKWALLAFLTLFSDGCLATCQKAFVAQFPGASEKSFVLYAAVFGIALCALALISGYIFRAPRLPRCGRAFSLMAFVEGAGTSVGIIFSMRALSGMEAMAVFPIRQGGLIMLLTAYGAVRYRDKFDLRTALTLLFGMAGIVLLNL